jgi:hypothetical protein
MHLCHQEHQGQPSEGIAAPAGELAYTQFGWTPAYTSGSEF